MNSKLLTTEEIAQILQISEITVRRYRKKGMPFIEMSKQEFRYDIDEVVEWFKNKKEVKV